MGVYIEGMKMPPSCYFCQMTNDGFYLCKANNPYRQLEDDCEECRPEWCPLVPVPPHGDLIDRDKLEKDIDKYIGGEESRSRFHHWVQVQRTVIPESEEAHT